MHIIHIASELSPIAKVGGLADVIHGLSKELCRLNHTVEIILPKYDCLDYSQLKNLKVDHLELWSSDGPNRYNNTIWSAEMDGLKVLLIEPHHPDYFFSRGMIYGCHDDIHRFAYFSRTAIEYLHKADKHPDVIHLHDWPTALVSVLYREIYLPLNYCVGGTLLTIHNLEHQGKCAYTELIKIGLEGKDFLVLEKMQDPSHPSLVNILKGGIEYADQITIVSPNYEKEIKTIEGGCGLQESLIKNQKKLHGILNGIDERFWDPQLDSYLVHNYNTHNVCTETQLEAVLLGKEENRRHLRTHLGLKECNRPIVAAVTRLVPQKGPELIQVALERTLEKGGQFILLGGAATGKIKDSFELLQAKYKNHAHVSILLDKDEALAHLIFSAADLFIIPSLFEPCGLTQMIALRYGTIPIARVTGGLADTVFDIDTSSKPLDARNGFTFDFPDKEGVYWALDRALACYKKDRKKWLQLLMNGMKMDFTWKSAAPLYIKLYEQIAKKIKSQKQVPS